MDVVVEASDIELSDVEAVAVSFKSIIAVLSSSSVSMDGGEAVEVVVGRETEVIRVRSH